MSKPRPRLRSCRNLNEYRREKPRFRLVKVDESGRRRQATVELVSESSLDAAIRAFLLPPPAIERKSQPTPTPTNDTLL